MTPANAETTADMPRESARERIFQAAKDLFYRFGIRAVGVEAIAAEAGATKMTLYRSFQSKDHLVAECLRDHHREFLEWWQGVVAPHAGDPKAALLAVMEAFVAHKCADESRGCPLANAIVELHEEDHPGRAVVVEHKNQIRSDLRQLCREMQARDPDLLADALYLLIEGAYISQLTFHGGDTPDEAVPRIARTLVEHHLRK